MATLEVETLLSPAALEREVAELDAYYSLHPLSRPHGFGSHAEYLYRVLERHRDLLERWGGMYWHSGPLKNQSISERAVSEIYWQVRNQFDPQGTYFTDTWSATNSHPVPTLYPEYYSSRRWSGPPGEFPYASGCSVSLRTGEAVSRAVLRDVRKRFAQEPEYVQFWESFFERLGHAWAESKVIYVTHTFAPSAFHLLGQVGENSCYRAGGGSEHSKVNLSLLPGSFVTLFTREEGEPSPEGPRLPAFSYDVTARLWGIQAGSVVGASNLYRMPWNTVRSAFTATLPEAFGTEGEVEQEYGFARALHEARYAYVNRDSRIFHPRDCPPYNRSALFGEPIQAVIASGELLSGSFCRSCENWIQGEVRTCLHCEGDLCESCSEPRGCTRCGTYSCPGCGAGRRCLGCSGFLCGACTERCFGCGRGYCPECVPTHGEIPRVACRWCRSSCCTFCTQTTPCERVMCRVCEWGRRSCEECGRTRCSNRDCSQCTPGEPSCARCRENAREAPAPDLEPWVEPW